MTEILLVFIIIILLVFGFMVFNAIKEQSAVNRVIVAHLETSNYYLQQMSESVEAAAIMQGDQNRAMQWLVDQYQQ